MGSGKIQDLAICTHFLLGLLKLLQYSPKVIIFSCENSQCLCALPIEILAVPTLESLYQKKLPFPSFLQLLDLKSLSIHLHFSTVSISATCLFFQVKQPSILVCGPGNQVSLYRILVTSMLVRACRMLGLLSVRYFQTIHLYILQC